MHLQWGYVHLKIVRRLSSAFFVKYLPLTIDQTIKITSMRSRWGNVTYVSAEIFYGQNNENSMDGITNILRTE